MNCPSCSKPILINANRCSECGSLIDTEDEVNTTGMVHRGALELVGIGLVIVAVLMFLGGARADAGGAVGLAIVLFVIGLVTTIVGHKSVLER